MPKNDILSQTKAMRVTRPPFAERLESALLEGVAYAQGKVELKAYTLTLPDPPPTYTAESIRQLRTRLRMSQPYFSSLLNVSPKTVQSWEQGTRTPSQSAARLLQFIEDPDTLLSLRGGVDTPTG